MVRENAEKEKSKLLPGEASKNSTPPPEWPPEWSDSLPPPYPPVLQPVPQPSALMAPPSVLEIGEGGPSAGTRSQRGAPRVGPADSKVALSLRAVGAPPASQNDLQLLQYWPFSSSDFYEWKVNHPPFSENPTGLKGLIESLMYSHQPIWNGCQQLLQTLFTT